MYAVRSLYDRAIISGIISRNLTHSGIFNAMPVRPGRRTACLFMYHCCIPMQRIPVVTQTSIFPPMCNLKSMFFCAVASSTALSIDPIHVLSRAQRSSGIATPFRPTRRFRRCRLRECQSMSPCVVNSIMRFGPISYEKRSSSLSVSPSNNPVTIAVSWSSGEGA